MTGAASPTRTDRGQSGFTLIEAMVALVILGIAAVGIIRVVEAHIDRIGALDGRVAAQWVAENALAEARLTGAGGTRRDVEMLGRRWTVRTILSASEDPDLDLARIEVRPVDGAGPVVTLDGFVDSGRVTL